MREWGGHSWSIGRCCCIVSEHQVLSCYLGVIQVVVNTVTNCAVVVVSQLLV